MFKVYKYTFELKLSLEEERKIFLVEMFFGRIQAFDWVWISLFDWSNANNGHISYETYKDKWQ